MEKWKTIVKKCGLIGCTLVGMASSVFAQVETKLHFDTEYWANSQLSYVYNEKQASFFMYTSRFAPAYDYAHYWKDMRFGHEFTPSKKWGIGVQLRHAWEGENRSIDFLQLYAEHRGKIGELNFRQRLSFAQKYYNGDNSPSTTNRIGVFVALSYPIPLHSTFSIRPTLSYLAIAERNEEYKQIPIDQSRRFQLSRGRFDLLFIPNQRWQFGLFALRQTQYLYLAAQFREIEVEGEKQIVQTRIAGKANFITPVFGAMVCLSLGKTDSRGDGFSYTWYE